MKNSTLGFAILVFIAGSSYGFIVPAVKSATSIGVLPFDFLPLQYLVGFAMCLAYTLIRRIKLDSPKKLVKIAALGLFTGLTSICYYNAVSMLPSAVALTLLFQYVWVCVVIEFIVDRRKPSRSTIIAIVIVLIGTFCAAGVFEGSITSLNPLGLLLGFGSSIFYSCFLFFSGRIGTEQPPAVRATMLCAGGLVITSLANPACYATSFFDPNAWPYAFAMSILGVIIPTTFINIASPHLSAGMTSIMASSELPAGIIAAWAFVGDVPTPLALFGSALVLVGIVFKQLAPTRGNAKHPESANAQCLEQK